MNAAGSFALGNDRVTFKNAVDLMPQLAKSPGGARLHGKQWWRYALRREELDSEAPSLKLVREAFRLSGYDLRELVVAFTRTRGFTHRKPSPEEVRNDQDGLEARSS